jgi:hypothetical protein
VKGERPNRAAEELQDAARVDPQADGHFEVRLDRARTDEVRRVRQPVWGQSARRGEDLGAERTEVWAIPGQGEWRPACCWPAKVDVGRLEPDRAGALPVLRERSEWAAEQGEWAVRGRKDHGRLGLRAPVFRARIA